MSKTCFRSRRWVPRRSVAIHRFRLPLSARNPRGRRSHRHRRRIRRAASCCVATNIAAPPGTVITVRDLFFNVPARKKFLRSDQTELAHIASLVTHYSLAHPHKAFATAQRRRATLLDVTPVEQLRERVYQVFGSRTLDDLIDLGIRGAETSKFRAVRRDRRPRVLRAARLRLRAAGAEAQPQLDFLFVNGRLIRDQLAAARALVGLSQPDAAGLLSLRAAVPRLRCGRSRRQRAPLEDRGALPSRHRSFTISCATPSAMC